MSVLVSCGARLTLVSLLGLVATIVAFYCMVQWKRALKGWGADVERYYRARRATPSTGATVHRIDDGAEP